MNQARRTALAFVVLAGAVVATMAWLSVHLLRAERIGGEARVESAFGDAVHLALWRMESRVVPVLARESARPYFEYRAFYPAERAYTRMWEQVEPGEVQVPSPLLTSGGEFVRLYFQVDEEGTVTSPQAPEGNMRDLAESRFVAPEVVIEAQARLDRLSRLVSGSPGRLGFADADSQRAISGSPPSQATRPEASSARASKSAMDLTDRLAASQRALEPMQGPMQTDAPSQSMLVEEQAVQSPESALGDEGSEGDAERSAGRVADSKGTEGSVAAGVAASRAATPMSVERSRSAGSGRAGDGGRGRAMGSPIVGMFRAVWLDGDGHKPELVLVRRVEIGARRVIQGMWLDWPALRQQMLAEARGLLVDPDLIPARGGAGSSASGNPLLLTSVPALLVPGPMPVAVGGWTPARMTLVLGWVAVLAGIGAIGLVLRASMGLSERRGRFVSAVTHELRTPLTTFRLYTEMLSEGMIESPDQRGRYLEVLRQESLRLTRIVQSVLEYARLSDRAARSPAEPISVVEVLDRLEPEVRSLVERSGMILCDQWRQAGGVRIAGDAAGLERIVLNLVGNACVYAGQAEDRRIHLYCEVVGRWVQVSVRDHGPGVPRRMRRRIFEAFQRGRIDGSQGGLGLGLALCRSIARSMSGDLTLGQMSEGAMFVLRIPRVRDGGDESRTSSDQDCPE